MVARWDFIHRLVGSSFIDYVALVSPQSDAISRQMIGENEEKKKRTKNKNLITPYNQFDNLIQSQIYAAPAPPRKCDIIKSICARFCIRIHHTYIGIPSCREHVYWWATATAYQISYYYFASISNHFPSTTIAAAAAVADYYFRSFSADMNARSQSMAD